MPCGNGGSGLGTGGRPGLALVGRRRPSSHCSHRRRCDRRHCRCDAGLPRRSLAVGRCRWLGARRLAAHRGRHRAVMVALAFCGDATASQSKSRGRDGWRRRLMRLWRQRLHSTESTGSAVLICNACSDRASVPLKRLGGGVTQARGHKGRHHSCRVPNNICVTKRAL